MLFFFFFFYVKNLSSLSIKDMERIHFRSLGYPINGKIGDGQRWKSKRKAFGSDKKVVPLLP